MLYSNRIQSLATGLCLICVCAWPVYSLAERSNQRGVAIPDDAPDAFIQGATHLDRNEYGADLTLPLDVSETWQLLHRVLTDLGIKPEQEDVQRQYLLSDWVLWVWNPKLETGSSKPPLKGFARTYERHRFEFTVSRAATNTGAMIRISDKARQKEVDITPDSEYSWLKWQDAPVQADAAWSFSRRLQRNFESALSSRIVPSGVTAPRIIEPVEPPGSTRESPPVTSAPVARTTTPTAVIVEPAGMLPVPGRPVLQQQPSVERAQTKPPAVEPPLAVAGTPLAQVPDNTAPTPTLTPKAIPQQDNHKAVRSQSPVIDPHPAVAEKPASVARKPALPLPTPVTEAPTVVQAATRPEKSLDTANPAAAVPHVPPTQAPRSIQGGLLVDSGLEATWLALLRAIDALGIKLQSSDQAQHMLTTEWINAMYDKKNQQFTLESKNAERWAFDLWGKGHQRHRFQLILIPLDGGARTMVYAYHTGFQVQTDRTPDSSQTLLYWKDHKTEPAVAMAFLRRLQLLVRQ